jgi:hypothetical protein
MSFASNVALALYHTLSSQYHDELIHKCWDLQQTFQTATFDNWVLVIADL